MKTIGKSSVGSNLRHWLSGLCAVVGAGTLLTAGAVNAAQLPLVGADFSSDRWQNCPAEGVRATSGKMTQKDDSFSVKITDLPDSSPYTLPDSDGVPCSGDEVICVVERKLNYDVSSPLKSYVILKGEVKKGDVKMDVKIPRCSENRRGACTLDSIDTEMSVTCYEPDPKYFPGTSVPTFSKFTTYYDGTSRSGAVNSGTRRSPSFCSGEHHSVGFRSLLPPASSVIAQTGSATCGE